MKLSKKSIKERDDTMSLNAVRQLHENNAPKIINQYLSKKTLSDRTTTQYERAICNFFYVESVDQITEQMIKAVDYDYVFKYFDELEKNGLSSSTINTSRLNAPRGLYTFIIKTRQRDSNNNVLLTSEDNPFNYYETVKTESNSYDEFTEEEIHKLFEVANEKDAIYFKLLYVSAVRAETVLNVTLQDFKKHGDLYVWEGTDKGMKNVRKPFEVVIREEQYKDLKRIANKETGKVFDMSHNGVLRRLNCKTRKDKNGKIVTSYKNSYCAKIGISEEDCVSRNLAIHSIKKSSVSHLSRMNGITLNEVITHSKDTKEVALKHYMMANKDINSNPSLKFDVYSGDKSDTKLENKLNTMTKEELVAMIMGLPFTTKEVVKSAIK